MSGPAEAVSPLALPIRGNFVVDLLLCGPFHFGIPLETVGKAGEPIIASVDRLTQVVFEVLSFARSM